MAKKKAAKAGFNMSQAIRIALEANPAASNKEALAAVQTANPGATINTASFGVAVSGLRKKMGIAKGPGRRSVKVKKPAAAKVAGSSRRGRPKGSKNKRATVKTPVAAVSAAPKVAKETAVSFQLLQAARAFVGTCGGADNAIAAIRQLTALQM